MSAADNLSPEHADQLEQILNAFEAAQQDGLRPAIPDYLPHGEPHARAVLLELIHSDLEHRTKAGEAVRVEMYLKRFPELEADPAAVVSLIVAEYRLRSRREPRLTPQEYVQRFPHYRSLLTDPLHLPRETADPTLRSTTCPWSPDPAEPPRPVLPGYEVLDELGRGGMGVVYKARQAGTKRLVALKMILSGSQASPQELKQFRAEAEAVACFQHPNIVQIYEIGEHQGMPFLALELVEGGNLAQRLAATPQPARETARLVETLARTMHYAHGCGIVHRDLKPANVLLVGQAFQPDTGRNVRLESLTYVPKITDFGLAKRLDDCGRTQSGGIKGTPCYMAPEQIQGPAQAIGPAVDVYALGVILYEMLTGQPPFRGPTLRDTLDQVCLCDPVPPGRLQPGVPRDLDTICLKCLAKEPGRRYASARALADELGRFLDGKPILARPASAWERGWKWARRQPAVALLLLVSLLALLSTGLGGLFYAWYTHENARNISRELRERQALDALRDEARDLIRQGQQAAAAGNWKEARVQLSQAQGKVGAATFSSPALEPLLAEEKALIDRLLHDAKAQEDRQEALRSFTRWRDEALLFASGMTGSDLRANRRATRKAAQEALAALGPLLSDDRFRAQEPEALATDCCELLLILAEATAHPISAEETAAGQAEKALEILERARRLSSRPTRAYHLQRASCLEQLQDRTGAAAEHRRADALAGQAGTASDHFLLGKRLLSEEGGQPLDLAGAIGHFRSAIREQPRHFWAHCYLAVAQLRSQPPQLQEAVARLMTCAALQPDQVWIYILRGYAHGQLGDFDDAEDDFRKAERLPLSDEARYTLLVNRGVVRYHRGWLTAARRDLEQAIQLKPGEFMAYVNLAQVCQKENRLDQALQWFDRAIGLQPKLARLYSSRAQLHRQRQETAAALRDYQQAIDLETASAPLKAADCTQLAWTLHGVGRYDRALQAVQQALKLVPDDPEANRLAARLFLLREDYKQALKSLDTWARQSAPTVDLYLARGLTRAKLGDYPGAIADYSRALELHADARVLARRGWLYIGSDSPGLALADFQEVLRLDPENGDAYNGRGMARVKLGRYQEAIRDAEAALRRVGDRVRDPYNAARIYTQAMLQVERDAELVKRQLSGPLKSSYQARALKLLRQALEAEPPGQRRSQFWKEVIEKDGDLDPLRGTPGLAQLAELALQSR